MRGLAAKRCLLRFVSCLELSPLAFGAHGSLEPEDLAPAFEIHDLLPKNLHTLDLS
jgi:hypothetical protein